MRWCGAWEVCGSGCGRGIRFPLVTDERGAGSLLSLATVGAIATLAVAMTWGAMGWVGSQYAANAADAAALAAADTLAGAVAGVPCEVAAETAQRNGATLQACELLALVATVRVSVSRFSIVSEAAARAGPPPEKYPRN